MKRKQIIATIVCMAIALSLAIACNQTPTTSPPVQQSNPVALTVAAGAGLKKVMEEIQQLYKQSKPYVTINYTFESSGSLQQQIEQLAPIDIFISASKDRMDALQAKNLLLNDTRKNLLTDRVVLIAPKNSTAISSFQDLTSVSVRKIALGEPKTVPIGKYAQEVLTYFGILDKIKQKIVYARNGLQILSYVETQNADAGIVRESSAKQSNQFKIVAVTPEKSHTPVVYPVAVIKASKNPDEARNFGQFLQENQAKTVFEKSGYKRAN